MKEIDVGSYHYLSGKPLSWQAEKNNSFVVIPKIKNPPLWRGIFILLEVFVFSHHQLRLNLLHGFQHHGHDNEQRRASKRQRGYA